MNGTDLRAKIQEFLVWLNEAVDEEQGDNRIPIGWHQPRRVESWGKRYAKVVKTDGLNVSAYCFIDLETGDILKPASWKAPAKGARGNVFQMAALRAKGIPHLSILFGNWLYLR